MASPTKRTPARLLPAALIALVAIPVVAGAVRLAELARPAVITPLNARFFAAPVPVVTHIVAATLFTVLGAFQFSPGFRRQWPRWHRRVGRLLVGCGIAAGMSGLWMTRFYPRVEGDGPLLYAFRLMFGAAMVACLVLGLVAVRRRNFVQHGVWITRAYAIAMGAGTQALLHILWIPVAGKPGELARALLMAAGWTINLAVAEWRIRKRLVTAPRGSSRTAGETRPRTCWGWSSRPAARPR